MIWAITGQLEHVIISAGVNPMCRVSPLPFIYITCTSDYDGSIRKP